MRRCGRTAAPFAILLATTHPAGGVREPPARTHCPVDGMSAPFAKGGQAWCSMCRSRGRETHHVRMQIIISGFFCSAKWHGMAVPTKEWEVVQQKGWPQGYRYWQRTRRIGSQSTYMTGVKEIYSRCNERTMQHVKQKRLAICINMIIRCASISH